MNAKKTWPRLLWVSAGASRELQEHELIVRRHFELVHCADYAALAREMRLIEPRVLCFECDRSSPDELQLMLRMKQTHTRVPILMLTEAHSEELAVWAFRSRIWNYIVKPVSQSELADNLGALAQIVSSAGAARRAHSVSLKGAPSAALATSSYGASSGSVTPALRRIHRSFGERLSASALAEDCGMSVFQFSRAFHRQCGITYRAYVVRLRISEACRLLRRPGVSVTKVGYAVGFNDASYFARLFRRHVGLTPSAFAAMPAEGAESGLCLPNLPSATSANALAVAAR